VLHVTNDGFQIAYEVFGRGDGPGFVLAQTKVGWERMGYVNKLKAHGKVLIVDPRGYGESSRARRDDDYSLEGFCDDLLAAADAVGLGEFVAWGYSNTAALAVALAAKSDRVVGLVCSGMDPFLDFSVMTSHVESEARAVGEGEYLPDGRFDWQAARAFYRDYATLQSALPAKFDVPAALIFGSEDPLVAASVERNRQRIEDLGFVIVPVDGLDHQSCVEAADVVVDIALPIVQR